jgi:hypothetical protein
MKDGAWWNLRVMSRSKTSRKLWWVIGLVAVLVLIGVGLLAAWWYSDLLLQYD